MNDHSDEMRDRTYPVREFMDVQRRHWRLERFGWGVFLLIVLSALLGLFSQGMLSLTTVESTDGTLSVEYQRFERNGAASAMTVDVHTAPGEQVQLEITGDLLDNFTIEGMQPEPLGSESFRGGLRLTLRADPAGDAVLHLAVRGSGPGFSRSHFALTGGAAPITVSQFIYP